MKNVVIFCLFLCFQLLAKYNSAYAHDYITSYSSTQAVIKNQKVESLKESQVNLVIKDGCLSEENNYSSFIEDDEEEEDDSITRKHTLLSKYFSIFFHAFTSSCCVEDRLSFYKAPYYSGSCKYIAQRVLRI